MEKPNISIIVPVYNVEQYLSRCIDSILNQTFTDFELLLIDDGSPDKSGEICDAYALKDSRIRVFHKDNGGVSSARNLGLDNANGEWVTFIDADDWIAPTFIEKLYRPICIYDDIQFIQAGCTDYVNNQIADVRQKYDFYLSDNPIYVFNHFRGLAFSKLFNLNKIIRTYNIKFDEQMFTTEDMAFTLDYLCHIRKYCFISEIGYYYRYNPDSLTHTKKIKPYNIALSEFKHLYSSVQMYIEKFNIPESERLFRKKQNASRLYSTINNLYKHGYLKGYRINHLKYDFKVEEINLLIHLPKSYWRRIAFWLYKNQYYVLFDFIFNIKYRIQNFLL